MPKTTTRLIKTNKASKTVETELQSFIELVDGYNELLRRAAFESQQLESLAYKQQIHSLILQTIDETKKANKAFRDSKLDRSKGVLNANKLCHYVAFKQAIDASTQHLSVELLRIQSKLQASMRVETEAQRAMSNSIIFRISKIVTLIASLKDMIIAKIDWLLGKAKIDDKITQAVVSPPVKHKLVVSKLKLSLKEGKKLGAKQLRYFGLARTRLSETHKDIQDEIFKQDGPKLLLQRLV